MQKLSPDEMDRLDGGDVCTFAVLALVGAAASGGNPAAALFAGVLTYRCLTR